MHLTVSSCYASIFFRVSNQEFFYPSEPIFSCIILLICVLDDYAKVYEQPNKMAIANSYGKRKQHRRCHEDTEWNYGK